MRSSVRRSLSYPIVGSCWRYSCSEHPSASPVVPFSVRPVPSRDQWSADRCADTPGCCIQSRDRSIEQVTVPSEPSSGVAVGSSTETLTHDSRVTVVGRSSRSPYAQAIIGPSPQLTLARRAIAVRHLTFRLSTEHTRAVRVALASRVRQTSPMFEPGSMIVAREVWHDLLWAARPAVVVSDDGVELVHWSPAGTVGCFATSRFFPGRDHLPREERQLVSLQTKQWHYRGVPARGTKLTFVRDDSWASIEATWNPDGSFAHWYVNFQRPIARTSSGYDTLDLVIDIMVARDWTWTWKDEEPFRAAIRREIFDADVEVAIGAEAERIQEQIESRSGPFDSRWIDWSPPREWPAPALPNGFADGAKAPAGAAITLSPDPVV